MNETKKKKKKLQEKYNLYEFGNTNQHCIAVGRKQKKKKERNKITY